MLTFSTVEVRWFGNYPVPKDIRAWFEHCPGQAEQQPSRRDYYLQPISDLGLSAKLREGGLEIKQRQRSHGSVHLTPSVAGTIEQWIKWRFPLVSGSIPALESAANKDHWTAVEKERWLKLIPVAGGPVVGTATSQARFGVYCQVEITSVRVGDQRWWTIGFELEHENEKALDRLLKVTGQVFRNTTLDHLTIRNSFGYPEWLASLSNNQ